MNPSRVASKQRCPKCARMGRDLSHDNLNIYDDGHQHCFACGYHLVPPTTLKILRENMTVRPNDTVTRQVYITLPDDVSHNYPESVLEWVRKYGISDDEMLDNDIVWSDKTMRLYFPIYAREGASKWSLRACSSRNFGGYGPKWLNDGLIGEYFYLQSRHDDDTSVVLVEDPVSAIKVGRHASVHCLFGTTLSPINRSLLRDKFQRVVVWLDYDAETKRQRMSNLLRMSALDVQHIRTSGDPKSYTDDEIVALLESAEPTDGKPLIILNEDGHTSFKNMRDDVPW